MPRRCRTSSRSAEDHQRTRRGRRSRVGRQAALEDTERIIEILEGADMVFVTAGLGGGTGTGAAPVVASLAKELNALTVAVVTKPFAFEGRAPHEASRAGLAELAARVDTVITIPNDKLLDARAQGHQFLRAFRMADDVLRQAVQGISDIITTPGLINRDFSDIRAHHARHGLRHDGHGDRRRAKTRLVEAAKQAINCPLMDDGGVKGARGILINITGSSKLGIHDVNEACALIRAAAEYDDVQINFGVVLDESMNDEVKITVIATGFQRESQAPPPPKPEWFDRMADPEPYCFRSGRSAVCGQWLSPTRNPSPRRFRQRSWMCPRSCAETGARFSSYGGGSARRRRPALAAAGVRVDEAVTGHLHGPLSQPHSDFGYTAALPFRSSPHRIPHTFSS